MLVLVNYITKLSLFFLLLLFRNSLNTTAINATRRIKHRHNRRRTASTSHRNSRHSTLLTITLYSVLKWVTDFSKRILKFDCLLLFDVNSVTMTMDINHYITFKWLFNEWFGFMFDFCSLKWRRRIPTPVLRALTSGTIQFSIFFFANWDILFLFYFLAVAELIGIKRNCSIQFKIETNGIQTW